MSDLRELLHTTTPAVDTRAATEAIVRRGRRRILRARAARVAALSGAAGVVALAVTTLFQPPPQPIIEEPAPASPEIPTESSPPEVEDGPTARFRLEALAPSEARPPLPFLDPADDVTSGEADVLRGTVEGAPVAVTLVGRVDRQQADPALVVDPTDPTVVYYNSTDCPTPAVRTGCQHAVRRVDLATGTDELVVADAISTAVRGDGTLATVLLDPPDQQLGAPPHGRIAVQTGNGNWEAWTDTPAGYHLAGWAGPHLLASVDAFGDTEGSDSIVVLSEPGNARTLTDHGTDRLHLISMGPDGRRALVRQAIGDCCDSLILLVDIATGQVLDQFDYRAPDPLRASRLGSWPTATRAYVIVHHENAGNGTPALLPLQIDGDRLVPDDLIVVAERRADADPYDIAHLGPDRIVMILGVDPPDRQGPFAARYADCRIRERRCLVYDIGPHPHSAYLARLTTSPQP